MVRLDESSGRNTYRNLSLRSLHLDKLRSFSSDKGKPLVLERSVNQMDIWEIDIADTVVCDYCNDDYTEWTTRSEFTVGKVRALIREGLSLAPFIIATLVKVLR